MNKSLVFWHPVPVRGNKGNLFPSRLPEFLDAEYKGALIPTALAMPKKTAISFEDCIRRTHNIIFNSDVGNEPGQFDWYLRNYLQWISDLGYHIEFNGDEFELHQPPVVES